MSVNRKAVVIYGSTDLWIYWDKADKLRLFYRDISHNLCAKRVKLSLAVAISLIPNDALFQRRHEIKMAAVVGGLY